MESNSIADGIENLCLGDELSQVVATKLGAIPKISPKKSPTPPEIHPIKMPHLISPLTPAGLKRQQRKKNRKDRRRSGTEDEDSIVKPMSKVEKLRAQGVQRSNSDQAVVTEDRQTYDSADEVTELIFKSQSSVHVNTGIRNLPDSFFSDQLPEEIKVKEEKDKIEAKDNKKKRKGRKRGKQVSAEEEDKKSSDKENKYYELNEKLTDDDVGKDIVTTVGDEQTVVSCKIIIKNQICEGYFRIESILPRLGRANFSKIWCPHFCNLTGVKKLQ